MRLSSYIMVSTNALLSLCGFNQSTSASLVNIRITAPIIVDWSMLTSITRSPTLMSSKEIVINFFGKFFLRAQLYTILKWVARSEISDFYLGLAGDPSPFPQQYQPVTRHTFRPYPPLYGEGGEGGTPIAKHESLTALFIKQFHVICMQTFGQVKHQCLTRILKQPAPFGRWFTV